MTAANAAAQTVLSAAAPPQPEAGAVVPGEAGKPARRPRIFSGMQPTGMLHIGNYLGALRNWVELQDDYDCVYCVVDLHAITLRQPRKQLTQATIDVANLFLASGIDPQRSIVMAQSHVPYHAELAWILNTITYMGELRRMTQFKEKSAGAEGESIGVGLFDYPVLQAADILLYQADAVPIGEDQKQHVELTRDLAERFNNAFGKTFVIPEPIIKSTGGRVMGLDDPTKKMSKSAGSEANYISLTDTPDIIRRKIKRAVTDSGTEVRAGADKPAISNLLTMYSMLSGSTVAEIEERYQGRGYARFKQDLGDVVVAALAPLQTRLAELAADKTYTLSVLKEGAERAESVAERTMKRVRERVGLVPRPV